MLFREPPSLSHAFSLPELLCASLVRTLESEATDRVHVRPRGAGAQGALLRNAGPLYSMHARARFDNPRSWTDSEPCGLHIREIPRSRPRTLHAQRSSNLLLFVALVGNLKLPEPNAHRKDEDEALDRLHRPTTVEQYVLDLVDHFAFELTNLPHCCRDALRHRLGVLRRRACHPGHPSSDAPGCARGRRRRRVRGRADASRDRASHFS